MRRIFFILALLSRWTKVRVLVFFVAKLESEKVNRSKPLHIYVGQAVYCFKEYNEALRLFPSGDEVENATLVIALQLTRTRRLYYSGIHSVVFQAKSCCAQFLLLKNL